MSRPRFAVALASGMLLMLLAGTSTSTADETNALMAVSFETREEELSLSSSASYSSLRGDGVDNNVQKVVDVEQQSIRMLEGEEDEEEHKNKPPPKDHGGTDGGNGGGGGDAAAANYNNVKLDIEKGKEAFHQMFESFDDVPLAAASLGQVHKATLRGTGEVVAVKLQRDRLRDMYDKDLDLMRKIANGADRFLGNGGGGGGGDVGGGNVNGGGDEPNKKRTKRRGGVGGIQQSYSDIVFDAEKILYREIDYRDEACHAIRFASDFGLGKGGTSTTCTAKTVDGNSVLPSASEWLRTPYVYDTLSSERVLVMEYVPSIKVTNWDELVNVGGLDEDDGVYLSECLARSYLRQFCCHGFFSTDPHPGNLGVEIRTKRNVKKKKKKNESASTNGKDDDDDDDDKEYLPPRLVFYDFGQACELKPDQSGGILDVIEGIVDTDVDRCVAAFQRMGVLIDNADLEKVRAKVRDNFETGKIQADSKRKRKKTRRRGDVRSKAKKGTKSEEKGGGMTSTTMNMEARSSIGAGTRTRLGTDSVSADSKEDKNKDKRDEKKKKKKKRDDEPPDVMEYFVLPAEYAFVARALSQMDGVGKALDSDFDFISASAPYLVEVKGATNYLLDEAKKSLLNWEKRGLGLQADVLRRLGFDARSYLKDGGKEEIRGGTKAGLD